MTEIEKMERYIELTGLDKLPEGIRERYSLDCVQIRELLDMAERTQAFKAICTAFNYGVAKGYRMAKAAGKW